MARYGTREVPAAPMITIWPGMEWLGMEPEVPAVSMITIWPCMKPEVPAVSMITIWPGME